MAVAIVVVILINAAFAFIQEMQAERMQAERAVEALEEFLPAQAKVMRGGQHHSYGPRRAELIAPRYSLG